MFAESEIVLKSNAVVLIGGILLSQVFQNVYFNFRLGVESLFVPDDFKGDRLVIFMVEALNDLGKTALP